MRLLEKPVFDVREVVIDCASSYRDIDKRNRIISASDEIKNKSLEYDKLAHSGELSSIDHCDFINGEVSRNDMIDLYDNKFAKTSLVKDKYKLMSNSHGTCPFCGFGQTNNLDHFLPKSKYPVFSVTPINLVPSCRDCNMSKLDKVFVCDAEVPLHPYYDDINKTIWLKANIHLQYDGLIPQYYVDKSIELADKTIYDRLVSHMNTYNLYHRFSIEASREIAENYSLWKKMINYLDIPGFEEYLSELIYSLEQVQKNTWKTALYHGLLSNISVFQSI